MLQISASKFYRNNTSIITRHSRNATTWENTGMRNNCMHGLKQLNYCDSGNNLLALVYEYLHLAEFSVHRSAYNIVQPGFSNFPLINAISTS
jgi:hypothetical protein